ncbi:unnamed protein product [Auanema sp. JU1783]|nr:unnamed protein product [Auanema sp. JU1783]
MNKLLFAALAVSVSSVPVLLEKGQIEAATLGSAVDFAQALNTSSFSCLFNSGFRVVFIRGYNPSGLGSFDGNAITNIRNAYSIGVGTEVFMTPAPASSKTGTTQFNELYTALNNNGINIRFIWIQVTSPVNWNSNYSTNLKLIDAIRNAARAKGVGIGFYTNQYDWSQITNGYTGYSKNGDQLWYWRNTGGGTAGASPPSFVDYYAFGGWTTPSVKQFAQTVNVCGIWMNKDIYSMSTSAAAAAAARVQKSEGPVVGGNL